MKKQDLVQKSIEIITAYYDNNLQPFFDCISDNVLWFGPRGGQELRGKEEIIKAWSSQENPLQFTLGNIKAKAVSTGGSNLEVLLEYYVNTHFPDGSMDQHHQRLHYSWGIHHQKAEAYMIHISNITDDNSDNQINAAASSQEEPGRGTIKIYAANHEDSRRDAVAIPPAGSRVYFRTVYGKSANEVTYYFNSLHILYIESTDRSTHSRVHTLEGPYDAIERLRYFEEKFGDTLLRAHASFLVNPLYVRSVTRFRLTLSDGTTLPIPEKKYTAFKKKLDAWNRIRATESGPE